MALPTLTAYLVKVDQLSAKVEAGSMATTIETKQPVVPWLAGLTPYAPILVSGFLFIAAFGIMLVGKIRDAKNVSAALLVALFAASIPQVLNATMFGTRQSAHAGPQEQPRNVRVVSVSGSEATVSWETQKETLGAVRYGVAPFDGVTAKTAVEATRRPVLSHEVTLVRLERGKSYELEILSGNVWYDNGGSPMRFVFR